MGSFKEGLLLLLNLLAGTRKYGDEGPSEWSHKNVTKWVDLYPSCGGMHQSPINLKDSKTQGELETPLQFENYDKSFFEDLVLENNGHSAEIALPETENGERPILTGGLLTDRYEAHAVHFHWGSLLSKGSEHLINGRRYNAELHIVHKNVKYATADEASKNPDGIAVLGIMLELSNNPFTTYTGLDVIFEKLTQIKSFEAEVTITHDLTLDHFLGNINTKKFYAYQGSLTTPPCSEAVTWHVLAEPLYVSRLQLYKIFMLQKKNGKYLLNNNRPVQALNGREIYRLA